jgi:hypothetical protein
MNNIQTTETENKIIKLYNALALQLCYMLVKTGPLRRRITVAEVKYMRKTSGYTWTYYKTYTDITNELNITTELDRKQDYRRNWI